MGPLNAGGAMRTPSLLRPGRRVSTGAVLAGVLAVIGVFLALLWLPQAAFAHANLARAVPTPNSVLDAAPDQVVIWFTEPIEPKLTEIRVLDSLGGRVDDGSSFVDPNDATAMSVGLEAISDGTYTVAWENVSTVDGHRVRGAFVFSVGQPISGESLPEPGEALLQSPAEPVIRWVTLVSVLAMVGGLAFELLVSRPTLLHQRAGAQARAVGVALASRSLKLIWLAIVVFLAASAAQLLLQAAIIHDVSMLETLGGPLWSILLETEWGGVWRWRAGLALVFGLALAAPLIIAHVQGRGEGSSASHNRWELASRLLAIGLGGGILWTLSLTSHGAATTGIRSAALLSDYLHLLAAAVWVGALFHFCLGIPLALRSLSARERRDCFSSMVPRFSVVAVLSVAVLVVTGFFNSWTQVTVAPALGTPYGFALLVKVVLVIALLIFGALNLVWVRPAIRAKGERVVWLKRFVNVEVVLAVLVLGAVAVLTSLEPARQVASRQGIGVPPPPTFRDTDEGTTMSLRVESARVGANDLTITLEDRLGNPIANVSDVRLRTRYLDADLGEETASATAVGGGSYLLEGAQLSIAGAWQAELLVTRPDAFDARTAFRFEVTPGTIADSTAISPSPDTANALLGGGLAVLGVLFMVAALPLGGWFTRSGAGVMVPGILGLCVGIFLLVNSPLVQTSQRPDMVNPFPPNPESLRAGKTTYGLHCQSCHGEAGRGDGLAGVELEPPPADLVVHVPLHPDGDLFGFIEDGIPGTGMAPLGGVLTDDEIWHVINYIRTLEE